MFGIYTFFGGLTTSLRFSTLSCKEGFKRDNLVLGTRLPVVLWGIFLYLNNKSETLSMVLPETMDITYIAIASWVIWGT